MSLVFSTFQECLCPKNALVVLLFCTLCTIFHIMFEISHIFYHAMLYFISYTFVSRISYQAIYFTPYFIYFISYYSGGQRRRVSFALAMLHEPPLLILDEPTIGVDPMLRSKYVSLTCNLDSSSIFYM